MSNYKVLTKCDDVSKLQEKLAYFASQDVDGLSDNIHLDPDTRHYVFEMFKAVRYSEDGTKSVGVLEVFPQYFEGTTDEDGNVVKPDLFTVINTGGEVLKVLASSIKYQEDVYDNLDENGIAEIREVVPETVTYPVEVEPAVYAPDTKDMVVETFEGEFGTETYTYEVVVKGEMISPPVYEDQEFPQSYRFADLA